MHPSLILLNVYYFFFLFSDEDEGREDGVYLRSNRSGHYSVIIVPRDNHRLAYRLFLQRHNLQPFCWFGKNRWPRTKKLDTFFKGLPFELINHILVDILVLESQGGKVDFSCLANGNMIEQLFLIGTDSNTGCFELLPLHGGKRIFPQKMYYFVNKFLRWKNWPVWKELDKEVFNHCNCIHTLVAIHTLYAFAKKKLYPYDPSVYPWVPFASQPDCAKHFFGLKQSRNNEVHAFFVCSLCRCRVECMNFVFIGQRRSFAF